MISQKHIKQIPGLGQRVDLFEKTEGGVIKVSMTPVDAQHALEADPEHWSLVEEPVEVVEDVKDDEEDRSDG